MEQNAAVLRRFHTVTVTQEYKLIREAAEVAAEWSGAGLLQFITPQKSWSIE